MSRNKHDDAPVVIDFDAVQKETAAALLISTADFSVWIPKSQITNLDREAKQLTIPQWLAIQKALV